MSLKVTKGDALAAEKARAADMTRVTLTSREAGDLIMLGIGGFTPLTGFMGKAVVASKADVVPLELSPAVAKGDEVRARWASGR